MITCIKAVIPITKRAAMLAKWAQNQYSTSTPYPFPRVDDTGFSIRDGGSNPSFRLMTSPTKVSATLGLTRIALADMSDSEWKTQFQSHLEHTTHDDFTNLAANQASVEAVYEGSWRFFDEFDNDEDHMGFYVKYFYVKHSGTGITNQYTRGSVQLANITYECPLAEPASSSTTTGYISFEGLHGQMKEHANYMGWPSGEGPGQTDITKMVEHVPSMFRIDTVPEIASNASFEAVVQGVEMALQASEVL